MPRLRAKAQVKQNLDLYLNDLFLRDGFFTTVNVGEADIYGRDLSLLTSVTADPSFADGRVWQSAFPFGHCLAGDGPAGHCLVVERHPLVEGWGLGRV